MRPSPLKLLLAAVLLFPAPSMAPQSTGSASLRASTEQFAVRATLHTQASFAAEQPRMNRGRDPYQHGTWREGVALLIVGIAGVVTGLIIDGPLITLRSSGAGGVGLCLSLR